MLKYIAIASLLAVSTCTASAPAYASQCGIASVYSTHDRGQNGNHTASGRRLVDSALTAAHRSLPFGTKVTVTNKANNRSIIVEVTDRGPFVRGRIIDLTRGGASALGFSGLAHVCI